MALLVSIVLVLPVGLLSACNNNSGGTETLTGTTAGLLTQLIGKSEPYLPAGASFGNPFTDPVTASNSEGILGLTSSQFNSYVEEATVAREGIMSIAHQVVLIKCKNIADTKKVMDLIAAGFDSGQWICVFPDRCFVQASGSYVLLVASSAERATALEKGFSDLAGGNVGKVNTFYTKAG